MAVLGTGMGLIVSQLGCVIQSSVDASGRGEAGGLQFTSQQLGSSMGVALLGAIVLSGLASSFVSNVTDDRESVLRHCAVPSRVPASPAGLTSAAGPAFVGRLEVRRPVTGLAA